MSLGVTATTTTTRLVVVIVVEVVVSLVVTAPALTWPCVELKTAKCFDLSARIAIHRNRTSSAVIHVGFQNVVLGCPLRSCPTNHWPPNALF